MIYALPNLYGEDPAIQITTKDSSALSAHVIPTIAAGLKAQHIPYESIKKTDNNILIRFPDTETQLKAQDIVSATLGSNYSVALNLAPRTPKWLQAIGAHPMKLGLDLRGGIHFLFHVDVGAMLQLQEPGDRHTMGTDLREAHIRYTGIKRQKAGIVINFRDQTARDKALPVLQKNFPEYIFKAQNLSLVGNFSKPALVQIQQHAVSQITSILRNRINELGVAEPVIQQQGATNISVDLPGIQDTARAKDLIGKVATVRLQLQDMEHDAAAAAQSGVVPFGSKLYTYDGHPVLLKNQIVLKGTSIISASSRIGEDARPEVAVRVSGSDVSSFNRITAENIGKPMATVYVGNSL